MLKRYNLRREKMNKEVLLFTNVELGLQVRAIKNDDGNISLNVEDTARGLGMIKRDIKNGKNI